MMPQRFLCLLCPLLHPKALGDQRLHRPPISFRLVAIAHRPLQAIKGDDPVFIIDSGQPSALRLRPFLGLLLHCRRHFASLPNYAASKAHRFRIWPDSSANVQVRLLFSRLLGSLTVKLPLSYPVSTM